MDVPQTCESHRTSEWMKSDPNPGLAVPSGMAKSLGVQLPASLWLVQFHPKKLHCQQGSNRLGGYDQEL